LQLLLHCWFFYITIVHASLIFLHHKWSCIVKFSTTWHLFFVQLVLFLIFVILCFLQDFQFCDCSNSNIVRAIMSYRDVYLFCFMGSICFVMCIDFNVNLFCFVEFIIHFQCVFIWCRYLCGYNHEHCLGKYFPPLVFIFLCFCTMSNGHPNSLPSDSILMLII